jgi:hypothetical protein
MGFTSRSVTLLFRNWSVPRLHFRKFIDGLDAKRVPGTTIADDPTTQSVLKIWRVISQRPGLAIDGGRVSADSSLNLRN